MAGQARLIDIPRVPDHVHTRFLVQIDGNPRPRPFHTRDGLDRWLARHGLTLTNDPERTGAPEPSGA